MYTEDEKLTAQALISNKDFTRLLKKIFVDAEDKFDPSTIDDRTNEQLGELVRADSLAERKIAIRYSRLLQLGTKLEGNKNNKVKE